MITTTFRTKIPLWLALTLVSLPLASRAADPDQKGKVKFTLGPATARMEDIATINVPQGYVFLDGKTVRDMLKQAGEPVSGEECGSISATNEDWEVLFRFDKVGYVKDDEKDSLNADKLLEAIKRGTAEANKYREKNGLPPMQVIGWEQPPKYNPETHNLEWAIRGSSGGEQILNYNTRLLGRKGVMEAVLIVAPEKLQETMPAFKQLLAGYNFQTGQSYAEYRSGDKVAKYGLTALVVGGAAVGAAKLGLFAWAAVFLKKAWKLVIIAVAAVASFFKKMFARLSGKDSSSERPTIT